MEEFEKLCRKLEHYETPKWAVEAILKKVILTEQVIDPCAGTGVLTKSALDDGYCCYPLDIYDFGCDRVEIYDWLSKENKFNWLVRGNTVLMNPPFSKACEFIEKSFEQGARKVLCFQRFSWLESKDRREFWNKYPPKTVHLCAERATCYRHDIPINARGKRYNPETGKELSSSPTAHAWFEFERDYNGSMIIERLYKD